MEKENLSLHLEREWIFFSPCVIYRKYTGTQPGQWKFIEGCLTWKFIFSSKVSHIVCCKRAFPLTSFQPRLHCKRGFSCLPFSHGCIWLQQECSCMSEILWGFPSTVFLSLPVLPHSATLGDLYHLAIHHFCLFCRMGSMIRVLHKSSDENWCYEEQSCYCLLLLISLSWVKPFNFFTVSFANTSTQLVLLRLCMTKR